MVEAVLNEMIAYFGDDARRINHALKVYGFAKAILSGEASNRKIKELIDEDVVSITEMAAILHDIGIKEAERKYNSSAGRYQELEGPAVAEEILERCGIDPEITERICYLVGHHHTYGKIDGDDFQVLVEADFLVNAHEDEMDETNLRTIYDKYMKTGSGRRIFEGLYLKKQ
ncbi:MAG: HD domain-containing protein [Clostridiales bacterium]|nr:HD domain-containing protein [Clostridiales bacterium]